MRQTKSNEVFNITLDSMAISEEGSVLQVIAKHGIWLRSAEQMLAKVKKERGEDFLMKLKIPCL